MEKELIEKARRFVAYVADDYNKNRHIIATLGSFGVTFDSDVEELLKGLNHIEEYGLENEIRTQLNI